MKRLILFVFVIFVHNISFCINSCNGNNLENKINDQISDFYIFFNSGTVSSDISSNPPSITAYYNLEKILNISSYVYSNFQKYFQRKYILLIFSDIFSLCNNTFEGEPKWICSAMLYDWVGEVQKSSKISLNDIIKNIDSTRYFRRDENFFEHYPPLNLYMLYPINEFRIGEFLFGEVYVENENMNYAGLWILKAGDTHRQEFTRVYYDSNIHISSLHGYVEDNRLFLDVSIQNDQEINGEPDLHKLLHRFVLKNDGERNLYGCYNALYFDVSANILISKNELPISSCKNLLIKNLISN